MIWHYGTFGIAIISFIISLAVQINMSSTFSKYSRINNKRYLTGSEVAQKILASKGLYHVRVEKISGNLTDHFDPKANAVRLSDSTYNSTSVAAIGVAAAVCTANAHSIKMLVDMNADIAITAKVFDMLDNDGQNKIITAALELKKDDFQKLGNNQTAFIESLKRWVYGKLNFLDTSTCYQFLVSVYGSIKPTDLSTRLIYIKDCGTSYVNLLQVAKQLEA
jgi:hypothetical protein